jgi:hypothetical protein
MSDDGPLLNFMSEERIAAVNRQVAGDLWRRCVDLQKEVLELRELVERAIELHDFLWENLGVTADWPLNIGGDDESAEEFCKLMNGLQWAIVASGKERRKYSGGGRR